MATKKFYAVKKGIKVGIYNDWDECKQYVNGYPGAEFKGFSTIQEAEAYMDGCKVAEKVPVEKKQEVECVEETKNYSEDTAIAYVDGSFKEATLTYGSGVIILYKGKEYRRASFGNELGLVEMRNVAGEIKAAEMAMQWCIDNSVKKLVIHHDYKGIADWCTGVWKANKVGTKAYKAFYNDIIKDIDISFVKVKGHSGDKYNDIADELACSML